MYTFATTYHRKRYTRSESPRLTKKTRKEWEEVHRWVNPIYAKPSDYVYGDKHDKELFGQAIASLDNAQWEKREKKRKKLEKKEKKWRKKGKNITEKRLKRSKSPKAYIDDCFSSVSSGSSTPSSSSCDTSDDEKTLDFVHKQLN